MKVVSDFVKKYYDRLLLDPLQLDEQPTFDKLCRIVEAHVTHIPFENIAQHGGYGGLQTLDIHQIIDRILTHHRGGFCFELNGLLYELLHHHLHYDNIILVPGNVGRPTLDDPSNIEFFGMPTHMFLLCAIPPQSSTPPLHQSGEASNDTSSQISHDDCYIVDVAFGEPAIHPLKYICDEVQLTPEGMISKVTKDDDIVTLHWYMNDKWLPRLRWKYSDTIFDDINNRRRSISSFHENLRAVQTPESNFSRKLICTKVSRTHKYTLAGNKYKVTGPPRFALSSSPDKMDKHLDDNKVPNGNNSNTMDIVPNVTIEELSSTMDVRKKLLDVFGIPFDQTETLDVSKSIDVDARIWSQL